MLAFTKVFVMFTGNTKTSVVYFQENVEPAVNYEIHKRKEFIDTGNARSLNQALILYSVQLYWCLLRILFFWYSSVSIKACFIIIIFCIVIYFSFAVDFIYSLKD